VTRSERLSIGALAAILAVTVAWWAAALWPLPPDVPDWVVRARAACFGAGRNQLPDAGGWLLLVGSPLTMVAALMIIGGGSVRSAIRTATATVGGCAAIGIGAALFVVMLGLTVQRAAGAMGMFYSEAVAAPGGVLAPLRRLDREAPALRLTDQSGTTVSLEHFLGSTILVTFAYARCETVCPTIIQQALAARRTHPDPAASPVVLIVTLDPWRDPPQRLPHIARTLQLQDGEYFLSGSIDSVETTLDEWGVERVRDERTGEVSHASLVYVIDAAGRIAFAVTGDTERIRAAVAALAGP
jgi:protein SCO1